VSTPASVVDHAALKVNQTAIVATVVIAFVGSFFSTLFLALIPLLGIALLLGTFAPQLAPFKQLYFKLLKPRGVVKPQPVQDRPEPHNFAQGLGGVFLGIASILLVYVPVAGLAVALLVAVLAFVNVAFGYCVGCQIFFQLERRGLLRA
jgi:amino acid transporter